MGEEKKCGIYKIENLVNSKVYIGQSKDIYRRFREHKNELRNNRKNNFHLQGAWNIYGEEKFSFSIIEPCDLEGLDELEKKWITYYDSTNENCGYNLVSGGNLNKNIPIEIREKIRNSQPSNKPIYQVDFDGNIINEWFGAREASKKLNYQQSSIKNCLKGIRNTYKNFLWVYKDEYYKGLDINDYKSKTPILKIVQLNLNLEVLNEWDNASVILRELGFSLGSILNCCKGKTPISNDFVWMFKDDINEKSLKERKQEIDKVRKKEICLLDSYGNTIKRYRKSRECAEDLNIDQGAIIKVCDGKRKSVGGHNFKYGELVV